MTAINIPSEELNWSEITIGNFKDQDTSPNKIVTRTARRIASKGFELIHIVKEYKTTEGFGWGRSSDAKVLKEQWEVGFVDAEQNEFAMLVRIHTIYAVNKRNPHDRTPPSREPSISFIPRDRETRKALGMTEPE